MQDRTTEVDGLNDWLQLTSKPANPSKQRALAAITKLTEIEPSPRLALQQRQFDIKVTIAQYSMHLDSGERARMFRELDRLLDDANWHDEDVLPSVESFTAFLKWVLYARWDHWSGLGISSDGSLLLAWRRENDRVTAEIKPSDEVRWTTSANVEGRKEIAAGRCSLKRFPETIRSHLPAEWFSNAD